MVDDNTPANDRNAVELTMMSDVVIDYEKEHYPIGKPTVAQLIQLSLDEKNMIQKYCCPLKVEKRQIMCPQCR